MRQFQEVPVGVEASELVTGERQEAYGDPLENYERQAKFIEAIVGVPVSRRQAMHIMIALKMCRDLTKAKRDNEVDICGYAHLLQMEREDGESEGPGFDGPAILPPCKFCGVLPGQIHHERCERNFP